MLANVRNWQECKALLHLLLHMIYFVHNIKGNIILKYIYTYITIVD